MNAELTKAIGDAIRDPECPVQFSPMLMEVKRTLKRMSAALIEARGALATLDHMNGKDDGLAVIRGGKPVGVIIDAALGLSPEGNQQLCYGEWQPFETASIEVRAIDAVLSPAERIERGVIDCVGTDADGAVLIIGREAFDGSAKRWCRLPPAVW